MRERARKKDGQRYPIPPQIFNGDEYRGVRHLIKHPLQSNKLTIKQDFDDFDIANEDDVLEEFLGLERDNPKV